MALLKQSTAYTRAFLLVATSDHITGLTGATATVNLSKAGAAFAVAGGTVTEIANGWYKIALTTTDTGTLGDLAYHVTATSADPTDFGDQVVSFDTQDATRLGLSALPNAAAAASGGLLISGSNSGTTTLGALTVTGALTVSDGVAVSRSSSNSDGVSIAGSGTGVGFKCAGGATGPGAKFIGGGTSGDGIDITTTAGDGLSITPTAGNGIVATANGTSKHGALVTGGTAGTSDGMKLVAGTGGVDLRANQTGNITGNLSGSAGSVTGAVGSVTGAVGSVTGAVTVGTNNDKTGYSLTQAFPTNFSALGISVGGHISNVDTLTTYTGDTPQTGDSFARLGVAGVGLTNLGDARIANLDATVSSRATPAQLLTTALTESYAALHAAPTLSQVVFEIRGLLAEKAVASTTLTVKGIDGLTAKETFTLNDSVSPTSISRAS